MDSFVTTLIHIKCDHFNVIREQIVKLLLHMQFPTFVLNFVLHPTVPLSHQMTFSPSYPYETEIGIFLFSYEPHVH
jgi:hypothetical protein